MEYNHQGRGLESHQGCNSGADNCKNHSNYDTSNRFGTNILCRSLFKKKTRASQNFNMDAIFQEGRHGVSWNVIFCLEMAVNGQERLLWQQSVWFEHAKCTVDFVNTIKMFRLFQYGRQFPRWPPSLSRNTSFALDCSRWWKRLFVK